MPPGPSWLPRRLRPAVRDSLYSAKGLVSRILFNAVIPLGAALPRTLISDLPGGFGEKLKPPGRIGPMRNASLAPGPRTPSLFGLAPCGVYPATSLTAGAVRSYRTFSPLPRRESWADGRTLPSVFRMPSKEG
jgi:hypothetical protein